MERKNMLIFNTIGERIKESIHETLEPRRPSVFDLTANYLHLEAECDLVTDKIETLSSTISDRIKIKADNQSHKAERTSTASEYSSNFDDSPANTCDEGPVEFKRRQKIARKFCLPYQIFQAKAVKDGPTKKELAELEIADITVHLYMAQLQDLETKILAYLPKNREEVVEKLKFVSSLFIDGVQSDPEMFAFVVREAAEILEYEV